jgi:hypothetical protein
VLLAEAFNQGLNLVELVTRDHGEAVVLDLVVQTTSEPVVEKVGLDVAAGDDLEFIKVDFGGSFVGEDGHTVLILSTNNKKDKMERNVQCIIPKRKEGGKEGQCEGSVLNTHVVDRENDSQKHSTSRLTHKEKHQSSQWGAESQQGSQKPSPMEQQGRQFHSGFHWLDQGVVELMQDGSPAPSQTSESQDGEEEDGLVFHKETGHSRVFHVGEEFQSVVGPGEVGHGVNVWVLVVDVGDRVVGAVLVLPPGH